MSTEPQAAELDRLDKMLDQWKQAVAILRSMMNYNKLCGELISAIKYLELKVTEGSCDIQRLNFFIDNGLWTDPEAEKTIQALNRHEKGMFDTKNEVANMKSRVDKLYHSLKSLDPFTNELLELDNWKMAVADCRLLMDRFNHSAESSAESLICDMKQAKMSLFIKHIDKLDSD